jgi:hypothetical protein
VQTGVQGELAASQASPDQQRRVLERIGRDAGRIAEADPGRFPSISASILTAQVKERATPETVARVRIILREEGLEWTVARTNDGILKRSLGPE